MAKFFAGSALVLMLVGFLVFDVLLATVVDDDHFDHYWGGCILGVVFAQIALLAVWVALAPVRFLIRLPVGFGGAVLVSLALLALLDRDPGRVAIAGATFLQWLAIQAPLWLLRLAFGLRLAWPGEELAPGRNETQFGIRQLLVWTGLVGVTLGIARAIVSVDSFQNLGRNPQPAISILLLLAMFNSLAAWPIIWAAFVRTWMPLWMVVAACCCTGISMAESAAFRAALGSGTDDAIFWWITGIQFAASATCLLLVRCCGFRLVHANGLGTQLASPK